MGLCLPARALVVVGLGLASGCARIQRAEDATAGLDAGADASLESTPASVSDAAAHTETDAERGHEGGTCAGEPGELLWYRHFAADAGQTSGPLDTLRAQPFGLAPCGDGLCLLHSTPNLSSSSAPPGPETHLLKLTLDGELQWRVVFRARPGQSGEFRATSFAVAPDGSMVVAGGCSGAVRAAGRDDQSLDFDCAVADNDYRALSIVHVTADGRPDWQRSLGETRLVPQHLRVAMNSLGDVVVSGHVNDTRYQGHAFVAAFDAMGATRFERTIAGLVGSPADLAVDPEGAAVMVGFFGESLRILAGGPDIMEVMLDAAGSDICLFKFDNAGGHVWSQCAGGRGQAAIEPKLALDEDGSIVVAGSFRGNLDFGWSGSGPPSPSALVTPEQDRDIYVARFAPDGQLQWQQQLGNDGWEELELGPLATPQHSVVLAFETNGVLDLDNGLRSDVGNDAVVFVELDEQGRARWSKRLGSGDVAAQSSMTLGDCDTFYFAADFTGDFPWRDAARTTAATGIVLGRMAR